MEVFLGILRAMLGLAVFVGIAWLFSRDRKAVNWRLVVIGLSLQIVLGALVVKAPGVAEAFRAIGQGFVKISDFSREGARFLFSGLALNSNETPDKAGHDFGVIIAFQILPVIVFFSTLSAALYYLGALQVIVRGIAWVMARTMGLTGPESLSAAGNIFLGQTEAPLLVKPFIPAMSNSELLTLMTGGMASLAGSVLAAYVSMLGAGDPDSQAVFASHLLSASLMNAPAGIFISKVLYPEIEKGKEETPVKVSQEQVGANLLDAMSNGAADGLRLALNVGGMLIAFISFIAMLNYLLRQGLGEALGVNEWIADSTAGAFKGLTLEYLLGQVFRVLAWLTGVEWAETLKVGSLLGTKTVVNEFVAYLNLAAMKDAGQLSDRSILISTYALCGFSNFASIAIQIGGIGTMAPDRQSDLSRLGLRALLGATLACLMTATIAGALSSF